MTALNPQYIFGGDRNRTAQTVRPERGRTKQNTDADARNVGARGVRPLTINYSAECDFKKDAGDDRQCSLLVAFQDAERQVAGDENACNQRRSEIAVIEAEHRPPSTQRPWRSDRAWIALRPFKVEFDPRILRHHRILVN